jgi:hypothetical protein
VRIRLSVRRIRGGRGTTASGGAPMGDILMKRLMQAALVTALAGFTLTGCYESDHMLLDASQARQPITQYQDWTYSHGDSKYHDRMNPRSDGWYEYDEAPVNSDGSDGTWEHHNVLLNYLESANGADIYVAGMWDDGEKAYVYGVIVDFPNGRWQSIFPSCDSVMGDEKWEPLDHTAAVNAGAQANENKGACTFASAEVLFQAMRNLVDEPGFWDRVEEATK